MTRQVSRRCGQGASFDVMDCEARRGSCELTELSVRIRHDERGRGRERWASRRAAGKGRRIAETKDVGRGQTQERAVLVAIKAGEDYDLRAQRQ